MDFTGLDKVQQSIVERIIHSSGDFNLQSCMRFSPNACEKAITALKSGAKILKIRNHNDYMKVQKKAPMRVECPSGELYLNWRKVSKVYDGVQLAGSTMSIPMLGQWDVESTAWFNMKKLEFVGTTKV